MVRKSVTNSIFGAAVLILLTGSSASASVCVDTFGPRAKAKANTSTALVPHVQKTTALVVSPESRALTTFKSSDSLLVRGPVGVETFLTIALAQTNTQIAEIGRAILQRNISPHTTSNNRVIEIRESSKSAIARLDQIGSIVLPNQKAGWRRILPGPSAAKKEAQVTALIDKLVSEDLPKLDSQRDIIKEERAQILEEENVVQSLLIPVRTEKEYLTNLIGRLLEEQSSSTAIEAKARTDVVFALTEKLRTLSEYEVTLVQSLAALDLRRSGLTTNESNLEQLKDKLPVLAAHVPALMTRIKEHTAQRDLEVRRAQIREKNEPHKQQILALRAAREKAAFDRKRAEEKTAIENEKTRKENFIASLERMMAKTEVTHIVDDYKKPYEAVILGLSADLKTAKVMLAEVGNYFKVNGHALKDVKIVDLPIENVSYIPPKKRDRPIELEAVVGAEGLNGLGHVVGYFYTGEVVIRTTRDHHVQRNLVVKPSSVLFKAQIPNLTPKIPIDANIKLETGSTPSVWPKGTIGLQGEFQILKYDPVKNEYLVKPLQNLYFTTSDSSYLSGSYEYKFLWVHASVLEPAYN